MVFAQMLVVFTYTLFGLPVCLPPPPRNMLSTATGRTEFVNVQPALEQGLAHEQSQLGGRGRMRRRRRRREEEEEEFGIPGHGLSEADFMVRQRYLENSGCVTSS